MVDKLNKMEKLTHTQIAFIRGPSLMSSLVEKTSPKDQEYYSIFSKKSSHMILINQSKLIHTPAIYKDIHTSLWE